MALATVPIIGGLLDKLLGTIDKTIEDKDLKAKLTADAAKEVLAFSSTLITQQTIPWVDATVKLMYAWRDVGISLVRPVGAVVMACFAAYMMYKQLPVPGWAEPVLAAFGFAPAAWGLSRHVEKNK